MKRERKVIIYPKIKIIKPFFWKQCRFCHKEFRKEQGFKIEDYTQVNPRLYDSYCCNECAKDINEVKEKVKKSKARMPPPQPPRQE